MKLKIRTLIESHQLEDICLTGFMDIENGIMEFYPDMRFVYFGLGDHYLEFQSIDQFSKLKLQITNSVMHNFEIEEDTTPAKSSIREIILVDTLANNTIDEFLSYNVSESSDDYIICDAVEIKLKSGQLIFIDPTFHYGIGIGGIDQKEWWKNNIITAIPSFQNILVE